MAYLPSMHHCGCGRYLGPDNGDGICGDCESHVCPNCGEYRDGETMEDDEVCSACRQAREDRDHDARLEET